MTLQPAISSLAAIGFGPLQELGLRTLEQDLRFFAFDLITVHGIVILFEQYLYSGIEVGDVTAIEKVP